MEHDQESQGHRSSEVADEDTREPQGAGGKHSRLHAASKEFYDGRAREAKLGQHMVSGVCEGQWFRCNSDGRVIIRLGVASASREISVSGYRCADSSSRHLAEEHATQSALERVTANKRKGDEPSICRSIARSPAEEITYVQRFRRMVEELRWFGWTPDYGKLLRLARVIRRQADEEDNEGLRGEDESDSEV